MPVFLSRLELSAGAEAVVPQEGDRVMGDTPTPTTGETVPVPLLRDPPPPPGYVDPLEGSAALHGLVATDVRDEDGEPSAGSAAQRRRAE